MAPTSRHSSLPLVFLQRTVSSRPSPCRNSQTNFLFLTHLLIIRTFLSFSSRLNHFCFLNNRSNNLQWFLIFFNFLLNFLNFLFLFTSTILLYLLNLTLLYFLNINFIYHLQHYITKLSSICCYKMLLSIKHQ